ncbi:hypothetical protein GC096_08030 [Paenibacillus sp. LMG 31461]|uniref:Kanamycin nucleotidyltransferase C-terminal domain-containing protein n=1 Tax=Paenibacillus plantarum TaxID=2654975 RepID=A0ABX1X6E1_9BACL|nr:kanamycin nucleotidyltransferase C-terminal domain-containing protein [Paenibacillus plantarum]NOU63972.1 hypothetical protein [Paenibacillus plantarum]
MHMNGPVNISRNERLETCHEIASRLHEVYGEKILAIGVYGSVSRGTDGPFSDIEMFCVLNESSESVDFSYEWSAGPWKAEVEVRSADVLLKTASTVEGSWPLTQGLHNQKLFSTGSMVLPEALELPSRPEGFDNVVRMVMSGELSEPSKIVSVCENFWNGLVKWAAEHDYVISTKRIPF